jgi:DNA modification methylase
VKNLNNLDTFKTKLNIRDYNIKNSAKTNGSSDIDSIPYLKELNIEITEIDQSIQFKDNNEKIIHRWTPYIQGFSAEFVQSIFDKYKMVYNSPKILDPFAGSGTVVTQANLNSYYSLGIEINPWMSNIANTKVNADKINTIKLTEFIDKMNLEKLSTPPSFLENAKHFDADILDELRKLKFYIENSKRKINDETTYNSIRIAFASILIPVSNLKRSPCLGYSNKKKIDPIIVRDLFINKIKDIIIDVDEINKKELFSKNNISKVITANSSNYSLEEDFDLIITSPPYMNGMDYAINYKIEMSWLNFTKSQKEIKDLKEEMVVCDNVSKITIKEFSEKEDKYSNNWIDSICREIEKNINHRGAYRRKDMAGIVHKYFDDMYKIMKNVVSHLRIDGRLVMVIGDSLIVDVYIPTDLILAKIATELGLELESIIKARGRRSGQIRSYKLRETIVTLKKI